MYSSVILLRPHAEKTSPLPLGSLRLGFQLYRPLRDQKPTRLTVAEAYRVERTSEVRRSRVISPPLSNLALRLIYPVLDSECLTILWS